MERITLNSVSVGKQVRRVPHNNSNMRMHWTVKNQWKHAWQKEIEMQIMINRKKLGKLPLIKPEIKFIFYMCKPYDLDGAYNAAKPLLDSLKIWKSKNNPGMGIITDDDDKNLSYCVLTKKVYSVKEERVELIIN